jgi:crossover junction endodeoxyribonuclease RusA
MIRIELPYPPSTNNLFSNGKKGRFKSLAYKAWLQLAAINIKDSHRQNLGPYSISICLKRPDMRRRDIGNFEKAVSDLLVSHGVVKDDSLCQRLVMTWDNGISADCVVLVHPYEQGLAA